MSENINREIFRFYFNLGRELERVRLANNLTIEEAGAKYGLKKANYIRRIEAGKHFSLYAYFRLAKSYQQKWVVRLEDEL